MYEYICIYVHLRFYMHTLKKPTGLRSYLCFISLHLDACPRAFTAPRKITCALLIKTSVRSAEELARHARPELLRDQFRDFVLSLADCPADEEGDDRGRHGDNSRCGPRRQHERQQEHYISTKS